MQIYTDLAKIHITLNSVIYQLDQTFILKIQLYSHWVKSIILNSIVG